MSEASIRNPKGIHLNCEANDPHSQLQVCVAHRNHETGIETSTLHRLVFKVHINLLHPDYKNDKEVTITAHTSRPSYDNPLLGTQTYLDQGMELIILVRKEAPCDTRVYLELWIDSKTEPYNLEATGWFQLDEMIKTKLTALVQLHDVNDTLQAVLTLTLISKPPNLAHTCSKAGSLTAARHQLDEYEGRYSYILVKTYKQVRPGDNTHWYTSVPTPHEMIPLVLVPFIAKYVSVPKQGYESKWLMMFQLACMHVLLRPIAKPKDWNNNLSPNQRARIINYMFTLPFTGHIYVKDRVRGENAKQIGVDVWNTIRSRPISDYKSNEASFDCEDSAIYMLESHRVLTTVYFEDYLLQQVQETVQKQYPAAWLAIGKIKIGTNKYSAHAYAVLPHKTTSLLLEGTCLTSGVWEQEEIHTTDALDVYYYNGIGCNLFTILDHHYPSHTFKWADMLQLSMPTTTVKDLKMYSTPITMVMHSGESSQRIYEMDTTMQEMMTTNKGYVRPNLAFIPALKDPIESIPISWFDSRPAADANNPNPFHCACKHQQTPHKHCLFYYTSPRFYATNKSSIDSALNKLCANKMQWTCARYNVGRELDIVRYTICVYQ